MTGLRGEDRRCTLIAFIDDASSRVMAACFTPAETTQAYLDGLHAYVLAYGCPAALYSDRHVRTCCILIMAYAEIGTSGA